MQFVQGGLPAIRREAIPGWSEAILRDKKFCALCD